MTEKDHGADLRPILPTTRAIIERHLHGKDGGPSLWARFDLSERMLAWIARERTFYEGQDGRCPPVAPAVEPVQERTDEAA
jgi:hypothetical protein